MKRIIIPLSLLIAGGCANAGTATTAVEGNMEGDSARAVLKIHPPATPPPVPKITARRGCDDLRGTMALVKTQQVNNFGNPLWYLMLPNCRSYVAVVGRAHTQNLPRHDSGNESPLPPGVYRVARQAHNVAGQNPELGGTHFIDLTPNFRTGRTELGIHWDPSFNRDKVKDGTAGCIALTNSADLDAVYDAIRRYGIHTLMVQN